MANTNCDNRAAEMLMSFHQPLFENVLTNAARDEERWNHRVETFETLGLLDFTMASPLKPTSGLDEFAADQNGERVYVLPEKQLSRSVMRNRLARKVKAHRTLNVARHRLRLDREQVADEKYRRDIAKVLAYKWVLNLEPGNMDMMLLKFMDVFALEHLLDTLRLNNISAKNISSFLLRRSVDELLDKNEKLQTFLARVNENMACLQEQAIEEIRHGAEVILSTSRLDLAAIASQTQSEFDTTIADNGKRAAEDAVLYARKVAERAAKDGEDPDESFRRAVDRKLARRKAARKRLARMRRRYPAGFSLWLASRMMLVLAPLLLAFHIEVGGVPLVNSICRLLNWGC
ncbi:MAG: hypothetical protein IT342_00615 [Candidatus Melainabacteria bacterium]|nr:hypothetical protein [Candidatus Melainabacteria bacterium]